MNPCGWWSWWFWEPEWILSNTISGVTTPLYAVILPLAWFIKAFWIIAPIMTFAVHFGPRVRKPSKIDYETMQPHFCYFSVNTICATFENTSQNMSFPPSSHLQKYHRSRNPVANVHCHNKDDAMHQIFSDTPTVDGGEPVPTSSLESSPISLQFIKLNERTKIPLWPPSRIVYASTADPVIYSQIMLKPFHPVPMWRLYFLVAIRSKETEPELYRAQVPDHQAHVMEGTGAMPQFLLLALALACTCLNYSIDPTLVGYRTPLMFATGQFYWTGLKR